MRFPSDGNARGSIRPEPALASDTGFGYTSGRFLQQVLKWTAEEDKMRRSLFAIFGATALTAGAALYGKPHAQPPPQGTPQARGSSGANVGTLTCNVAGGIGFIFGSSKELSCLFARTDGIAERYT